MDIFWVGVFLVQFFLACSPSPMLPNLTNTTEIPLEWKDEPVICLLDSEIFIFVPRRDTNYLEVTRTAAFLINKRNPPLMLDLSFYDYEAVEAVPEITMEVQVPGSKTLRFNSQSILRKTVETRGELSTGLCVRTFHLPRYTEGTKVVFREHRLYRWTPIPDRAYLRTEYPTLERRLRFVSPAKAGLKIALQNTEHLPLETSRQDAEEIILAVSGHNLQKIDLNRAPHNPEDWFAGIHFSLPPQGNQEQGWREMGDHYLRLISPNLKTDDSVRAAASRLKGDPDNLISEAFRLVTGKVRYLANEERMYGWIPRPAGYVLENGFGDCKEMANLLRALLAEKGLDAGLALVHSGPGFQAKENFPGLGRFNHAITYVKLADGSYRFLDPTVAFANAGTSYLHLVGHKALILRENDSRLAEIPMPPKDRSRITTQSSLSDPGSDGVRELRGKMTVSGPLAMSWIFRTRYSSPPEARERMRSAVKEYLGMETLTLQVDSGSASEVHLSYRIRLDGKNLGNRGLLLDLPGIHTNLPFMKVEGPVETSEFEQEDTWAIPEGFSEPQTHPFSFGAATGTWQRDGGTLRRRFLAPKLHFAAGDSLAIQRFRSEMRTFTGVVLWKP
jgi:hypothetical protein